MKIRLQRVYITCNFVWWFILLFTTVQGSWYILPVFVFVYVQWCPTYCIVSCFCFVFLCLICPVLPVSLDCPFLNGPSVFSNFYLNLLDIHSLPPWSPLTLLFLSLSGEIIHQWWYNFDLIIGFNRMCNLGVFYRMSLNSPKYQPVKSNKNIRQMMQDNCH